MFRSRLGLLGSVILVVMFLVCLGTLPWTLGAGEPEPGQQEVARYKAGSTSEARIPPIWAPKSDSDIRRLNNLVSTENAQEVADQFGVSIDKTREATNGDVARAMRERWPSSERTAHFFLGTDQLGRSLFTRLLAGGGISLTIGIAAALVSVVIGTLYGSIAGYAGGKIDAVMMRIVDILYGLPYILLVVILAVASGALIDEWSSRQKARIAWIDDQARELWQIDKGQTPRDEELVTLEESTIEVLPDAREKMIEIATPALRTLWEKSEPTRPSPLPEGFSEEDFQSNLEAWRDREPSPQSVEAFVDETTIATALATLSTATYPERELSDPQRTALDLLVLLIAIGGVSWLTLARVVRGQVLSLKNQPFVEAARAVGAPKRRIFFLHLLPNLIGPIVVYATLTVPQAILQESFLSFLGIGVQPPLPSWGNLAAEGLGELNTHDSDWWLLLMPCLLLAITLLALNFVGEGLRDALDPKRQAKR